MKVVSAIMILVGTIATGTSVNSQASNEAPLLLTTYINNGQADKARNLSSVNPTLFAGVKSHSGFITVSEGWHQYIWFFPVEGKPLGSTPWIIWTQGGPGVSTLYGIFKEIGPLKLVNGKVKKMPVSWASDYSILFIDTPIDAGFSYSDTEGKFMKNDEEVGTSLYTLVQQFIQMFPELSRAPLFLAGESYAGKFVTALGHYIHNSPNSKLNLKGLVIGSGFVDPPTLLHLSPLGEQLGLLDYKQAAEVNKLEDDARRYWKAGDMTNYVTKARDSVLLTINYTQGISLDNVLRDDSSLPTDFGTFVNRTDVRKALHVGNRQFNVWSDQAYQAFEPVIFLSVKPWLEELLDHYAVLCYNGNLDMVAGYPLAVHTFRSLNWSGKEEYKKAERTPVLTKYPGKTLNIIGYNRHAANFTEMMIRNAGHAVPADQPYAAKQMINTFIDKFKK
ncbi:probable serine carboxypeptidase CPVL [Pectinophora gossypiella]|uniref:probable serine carboxypeptidase CPVL n=1 Tax=Pectinophora gossypiella TaxID=13191 RepID=UPI00214F40C2|nr:probable serine carboxypeptidase CPVL [Pectinophora gossypiella]XP_049877986.1 probable serine carboxypeptidase CPVL [Pectinophora gossypiella]